MNRMIVTSLITCVLFSAVGGFGAPLLCRGADDKCIEAWRGAATGALTAAGTLGTLLARLAGGDDGGRP
jgi:hypothetical protein